MMITAKFRQQVLLILAGAFVVAAVCLVLLVQSLRGGFVLTTQMIEQKQNMLARLQAFILENNRYVNNQPAALSGSARSGFLGARDEAAATSELQAQLRRIVTTSELAFVSSRVLPRKAVGQVTFVGVRLDGTGNLRAVQSGLYALEHTQPTLIVDAATFSVAANHTAPATQRETTIRWQMDVYGALWSGPQ